MSSKAEKAKPMTPININSRLKPGLNRPSGIAGSLMACIAFVMTDHVARAHLTYTGRDFGTFSGLTNATSTITNQTVTGNYGWADAADGVLGDSHRGRAFRFRLENAAFVSLSVSANPSATATSLGGLTPAFSVYAGLAAIAPFPATQTELPSAADHDEAAASVAWRIAWVKANIDPDAETEAPTDGSWNAMGDFKIGGDGDLPGDFAQLSALVYQGSAAATFGASTVTGSLALPAGDYTIIIGGNDLANKMADTALSPHGIAATLSISTAPILSIAPKVFVASPTRLTGPWKLQFATSAEAKDWKDVTAAPATVDGQAGVVLDAGSTQQYFRFISVP